MGCCNATHEVSVCVLSISEIVLLVIGHYWIVIVNGLLLFSTKLFTSVQPPVLVHDNVVCLIFSLVDLQFFLLDKLTERLRGRDIRFAMLEFRKHYFQMVILVWFLVTRSLNVKMTFLDLFCFIFQVIPDFELGSSSIRCSKFLISRPLYSNIKRVYLVSVATFAFAFLAVV